MNKQVNSSESHICRISKVNASLSLNLDNRLVEISMLFHVVKALTSIREDLHQTTNDPLGNWMMTMKNMHDSVVVCNYKFIRDMSKNSNDDSWIISGLNHWLPSEYGQKYQQ
jgi:hypothetical protein